MTRPFILGVDLDGVCADYDGAMRDHVARFKGIRREDIPVTTEWSLVKSGWPFEDEADFIATHNRAVHKHMFSTMDAIEGCSDALWKLNDEHGVHIRIITFRLIVNGTHSRVCQDTVEFLNQPRPDGRPMVPYRDICFLKDKSALGDVDLLIDDAPHNVLAVRERHGEHAAMVFDQSYNQDVPGLRAKNWDDVVTEVARRIQNPDN